MTKEHNYEQRNIPGVSKEIKVTRDGDVYVNDRIDYSITGIVAEDGTPISVQRAIWRAFPDIPMRYTPSW